MKTYSYFTQNTLRIALCALLTGPLMTPGLADVFTVNNNNDSGSGSLRQAILEANAHPNSGAPDLIRFELTAANSRIQPLTPLDPITDSVTLDATSGNDCATAPAPQVEIDGQFAGAGANGLWAGTAATQLGVTIKGLAIYNFSGTGLYLFNNTNSLIAGNYLGTDATGQGFGKGNGVGLQIEDSRGVTVGGALPCARNVVSGNKNEGVRLADPSSDPTAGTTVIGNYIGVEARALMPMPNGIGVAVYAAGNQIGGAQAGMGNIIAGNFNDGIFVRGHLNHIQNNAIGTDPSGLAIWPNSHSGIYVEYGYTNDIVGNVIARNQRAGVGMFEAFETRIQQNSMFNNGGLGIDITPPGPNPNNPLHPGTGPNRKQNFPVIASAVALATGLHLHGTLNAEPNVTFVLEFFLNDACDPSGFGEGKTYLGPASVATDAAGNATFTAALAPIPPAPAGSRYITATATHPDGSSSEFSPCKLVTPTGPSVVEHQGLAHLPYGDATLQASNRFLRVSGLDATGSNGVTIALGGGRGWRGELGPLQLRGGDGLDVTLTEPFGPADPQDLSVAATGINIAWEPPSHGYTRITAKSACLACRHGLPPPNQPIPKGQLQLRLWDEASQLVDNIPLDNTTPLALSFCMASQTVAVASVAVLDSGDGGVACHYYLDEAVCFQAPPGKTYPPIKHLAVQFMDWPGEGSESGLPRQVTLRPSWASGPAAGGNWLIGAESLQQFGHLHQALGQAQMDASAGGLALDGLGPDGTDGVAVSLDAGQNRFSARWSELNPVATAPPGATFALSAAGNVAGSALQALGSMTLSQDSSGGLTLVNDFTGIGSQSALILVLENGLEVGAFRLNHHTPLLLSGGWPRSATVGPRMQDLVPPYGPICFYEDWPIDVTVFNPLGETLTGNQIRVLVDDAPALVSLQAVNFNLGGLPRFELTGEESSQAGLIFDGLAHAPLGNATVQFDSATGGLSVSGIGPSGSDGVRINTGSGGGATMSLGVINPDQWPSDASLHWAALDAAGLKITDLSVAAAAGVGAIFADFTGLGARAATVALYSNDTLVAYANGLPPSAPLVIFTGAGGGLPITLDPCILRPEMCYGVIDIEVWHPDPVGPIGSVLTIPGQGPQLCTRVQIVPEYPPRFFVPNYRVKHLEITGRNLASLNIATEGLVFFGLEHHALGQAEYGFDTPGAFAAGNLGSSGSDGVEVSLRHANTYALDMVALNPQPLPPGNMPGVLTVAAMGRLAGGAYEQALGSLRVMNAGDSFQLSADLSPAGASTLQVELWQGCQVVARFPLDNNGPALAFSEGFTGLSVGSEPGDDPCGTNPHLPLPPWWWWVKWNDPVAVATTAGDLFLVDRVRVSPQAGSGTGSAPALDALTQVSFMMPGPQRLVFIREAASRFGLNFDGNQHFPLGQATLATTSAGELVLDNLGSSGTDGVEILVGQAGYCEVMSPTLPLPPPGSSCRYDYHAAVDGLSDRTAATVSMEVNAVGEMIFTGDLSPLGATRYTVMALDGDTQVASVSAQPSATVAVSGNAAAANTSLRWDIQRYKCFIRIKLPKLPNDPGPVIRLLPSLSVRGDQIIILPENPSHTLGLQNRVLLTASLAHPEPKVILREALGLFGNGHTGLGAARLAAQGERLIVSGLGASGEDGVMISLADSRQAQIGLAPFDFGAIQGPWPVPWFEARALGQLGGAANHDLGAVRFTGVPGGLTGTAAQVTADFSAVGASTHTIEVWRSGLLVLRLAGQAGVVATVSAWPAGIGRLGGDPASPPCFVAALGGVADISIAGAPALQGDELRILVENPTAPIGSLQGLSLTGRNLRSFTIMGASRTPTLAPRVAAMPSVGGGLQLSIPTAFGYSYTLEAVSALGPQPLPWSPVQSFLGDGSVHLLAVPATSPGQFLRVRVD